MAEHGLTVSDLDGPDIDDFDSAEYLGSEQAVAAYLTAALETNDASMLAAAIGNVARARGMADIAKASGLAREGLYKALRPNSQPRLETITRVLGALGVRLVAEVIPPSKRSIAATSAKVAVLPEKPAGRTAAKGMERRAGAPHNMMLETSGVVRKTPSKSQGKPIAKPAVAKSAPKRAAAKPAAKRPIAKPAPVPATKRAA